MVGHSLVQTAAAVVVAGLHDAAPAQLRLACFQSACAAEFVRW
jgi:hypothetical protein